MIFVETNERWKYLCCMQIFPNFDVSRYLQNYQFHGILSNGLGGGGTERSSIITLFADGAAMYPACMTTPSIAKCS